MAKINKIIIYPVVGGTATGQTAIGTNWEDGGKTVNIPVSGGGSSGDQNNIVVQSLINKPNSNTPYLISDCVNSLDNFTVHPWEIFVFCLRTGLIGLDDVKITENYWLFKGGKGDYGVGGSAVSESDFLWLRGNEVATVEGNNPVVHYLYGDTGHPEVVLNGWQSKITVSPGEDVYFMVSEINDTGISALYRFVGADGDYGAGYGVAVPGDFLLLEDINSGSVVLPELYWMDMVDGYDVLPYPQMQKGDRRVVRILNQSGDINPLGSATIGGLGGVRVGNYTMLICMQNSAGGTHAQVGYKYAFIGNSVSKKYILEFDTFGDFPDEPEAEVGVLYLDKQYGNLYYWDPQTSNYQATGSVVSGTLVSSTEFKDTNNAIVVPDDTHLYYDTASSVYYSWNGSVYMPISGSGGSQIQFFNNPLNGTPPFAMNTGSVNMLFVNIATGVVWTWDGAWVKNDGASQFTELTDTPNDYTGEAGKLVAVNSNEDGLEFIDSVSWLPMLDNSNITDYPQMLEGEMQVIKIVDLNGDEVEGGTAVIGGWNGTTVGNNSLLICMEDSTGGDVTVGYKYAIIGNDTGSQAIIQVADYTELTNGNYQDSSVLYVTIDDGKVWKWNASTNQHDEVSSVVAGTLVSASVFEDLNNIPVTPDNSHLYFDTTSEIYYRWNGIMYENILDTPTEKINFFEDISDNPPKGGGPNKPVKKIWANVLTGSIWVWNGSQYITRSGGADLTLEQARQNGNVFEGDVEFDGRYSLSRFISSRTGSTITYEDDSLSVGSFNGVDFPTQRGVYLSFDPINEKALKLNIFPHAESKGLVGFSEFNKQGDRKAFAQIADLEDGYIPLPTEGTNGQVLTTDGDGTYTWENAAGGVDWTTPTDKSYGIWDTATGKIINSKLTETTQGAELNGRFDAGGYVGKNVTSNIDGGFAIDLNNLAEHYFLTQTDNTAITFTNMITANQTAVITITLTGTYTFTLPSWLKPLPYNDTYDGSINNEIVINIKRGGSSPLGYYSLTNLP